MACRLLSLLHFSSLHPLSLHSFPWQLYSWAWSNVWLYELPICIARVLKDISIHLLPFWTYLQGLSTGSSSGHVECTKLNNSLGLHTLAVWENNVLGNKRERHPVGLVNAKWTVTKLLGAPGYLVQSKPLIVSPQILFALTFWQLSSKRFTYSQICSWKQNKLLHLEITGYQTSWSLPPHPKWHS